MQVSEVFQSIHGKMKREDFIPISVIKDQKEKYDEFMGFTLPTWEECQKAFDYLEVDESKIFLSKKGLHQYYYFNSPTLIDLPSLEIDFLESLQYKERIINTDEMFQEAYKEKNYYKVFAFVDSKIDMVVFEEEFENIPDNVKYEIFTHFYTHSEYGFSEFNKEILRKALSFANKSETEENINQLKPLLDENGEITIYRGQGNLSSSFENAYSWTTDINTALFFAGRFDIEGKILKTSISLSKVVDYFDGRNESEVLVLPETIDNIEVMQTLDTKKTLEKLENEYLLDHYQKGWGLLRDKNLFFSPDGPHGLRHTRRVMINALGIALLYRDDLLDEEIELLTYACAYHDIGRTNDDIDPTHGKKSFKKMRQKKLIPYEKGEDNYKILKFIVENHNIDDDEALKKLPNYCIGDEKLAIFLYNILKDADGLDRVRFRDLNLKYLRLEKSSQLMVFSYHLLKQIK